MIRLFSGRSKRLRYTCDSSFGGLGVDLAGPDVVTNSFPVITQADFSLCKMGLFDADSELETV
jgi:hypothetical protein